MNVYHPSLSRIARAEVCILPSSKADHRSIHMPNLTNHLTTASLFVSA